jgi:antitoxin component of RelBE/YafQ-DinJ toxin-antitoxin module
MILGLSEHKNSDDKYIKEYLQRMIDGRQLPYKVNIIKDKASFLKEIEKRSSFDSELKDIDELKSLI